MITDPERHLRADAGRILRAAREVFADLGPEAPLEEIARRAGAGHTTVDCLLWTDSPRDPHARSAGGAAAADVVTAPARPW